MVARNPPSSDWKAAISAQTMQVWSRRGCLDSIQYTDGDTERDKMEKVVLHRLLESQKETE
jgi:hypothetical protein